MKTLLMLKIYAAVGIAILGARLAFAYLTPIELVQFFGTAIGIGIASTLLHRFFEKRAEKTGVNQVSSPNLIVSTIVITVLASTGIYILLSYIYSNEFAIGFEILFYALFLPAAVLVSVWLINKVQEDEYNKHLEQLKNK